MGLCEVVKMYRKVTVLISVLDAAVEFACSPSYIRKYTKRGLIRHVHVKGAKGTGRSIRCYIYRNDLEDVLHKNILQHGGWLTLKEVARRLHVSTSWVYRTAARGKVRYCYQGRHRKFLLEDCRECLRRPLR